MNSPFFLIIANKTYNTIGKSSNFLGYKTNSKPSKISKILISLRRWAARKTVQMRIDLFCSARRHLKCVKKFSCHGRSVKKARLKGSRKKFKAFM